MNSVFSTLAQGGPVIALLLLISVLALTLILVKMWQLSATRPGAEGATEAALQQCAAADWSGALAQLSGAKGARAELLRRLIDLKQRQSLSSSELKAEGYRLARLVSASWAQWLKPLEMIAALAPLLGLFGTVLGMIAAFRALEAAGAQVDPSILSGGIWQALLTTAAGLAVAMPVAVVHGLFERKLEVWSQLLQNDLEQFVTLVAQHSVLARPSVAAEPSSPLRAGVKNVAERQHSSAPEFAGVGTGVEV